MKRAVGWCTDKSTVAPRRAAAERASSSSRADTASSPDRGSSAIMIPQGGDDAGAGPSAGDPQPM
eukprot:scaffold27942_cov45-Isochrysis_galbana.AAC.1